MTARIRAQQVLEGIGVEDRRHAHRVPSAANEVWFYDDRVVRINPTPGSQRLSYEYEVVQHLPPEVGYPPILDHGVMAAGEWILYERVPGETLSRVWHRLKDEQRRAAVHDLANRLRLIHATPPVRDRFGRLVTPPFQAGDSLECPHLLPATRLRHGIAEARRLRHVDPEVLDGAAWLVERYAPFLDSEPPATLIHGDLHFENVLWHRGRITAVLDFEFARPGPPDLDLAVLLRFCVDADLHVAPDYQHLVRPDQYRDVGRWLREAYPELFDVPNLRQRLILYSIAYDVRQLLVSPPLRPVADLPSFHPFHRLRRTIEGRDPFRSVEL